MAVIGMTPPSSVAASSDRALPPGMVRVSQSLNSPLGGTVSSVLMSIS